MKVLAGHLLILATAAALWQGGTALLPNATAEIVIVPEDTRALEGNTLILTCVGYGEPTPEVTWIRNGTELTNTSRVSIFVDEIEEQGVSFTVATLEICSLDAEEDSGTYYCQASNENGTDTHSFEVEVVSQESVEIVIQPESGEFREGYTVILSCVAYGTPGNPNITWNRYGDPIYPDDRVRVYQEVLEAGGLEFVLSNLEICGISPEDAGVYSCVATLPSGVYNISDDFSVSVVGGEPEIVIAPEDTVAEDGNTVIFTCVAVGAPPPYVSWTFEDYPLTNYSSSQITVYQDVLEETGILFTVGTLEICNVMSDNTGEYSCVASSGDRNVSVYFTLTTVEDGPPEIVIAPENTTVSTGYTVLFSCVVLAGSSLPTVGWATSEGRTLSNDSRLSIYNTPIVESGVLFIHSILEICSVNASDENGYICFANNSAGFDYSFFLLRVDDGEPPDIVIAPSDTLLRVGSTALFTCVAVYSYSPPNIAWYRDGGEMIYNYTDGRVTYYTDIFEEKGVSFLRSILELCSVEPSDEGLYSCVIYDPEDPYRNISADFYIDVARPEEEVEIVIAPSDSVVTANTTVLLTCVAYGVPLPSSITWTLDYYTVYNTSDVTIYHNIIEAGGVLFLQSILEICGVREEQGGYYACSAGNDSASFELTVQLLEPPAIVIAPPPEVTVTEGDTVLLTCVAVGSPTPSISWTGPGLYYYYYYGNETDDDRYYVNQTTFTEKGIEFVTSILEICSIESYDEGEYSCQAENEVGFNSVQFNVTVEDQFEPPTIVIAPPDTEVDINTTVLLTCVAYGNPQPNISWYAGYDMLTNGTDGSVLVFTDVLREGGAEFVHSILQLCGVTVEDEALYSCVAENYLNSTQSEFYLNVLELPVIVIQPSDTVAPYGSTVLLTCVAVSKEYREDALTNILWLQDSELVNVSSDSSDSPTVRVYETILEEGGVGFTRSVLELCSVTFAEEGAYSCVANDSVGYTASTEFTLTVFTEVSIVIISDSTDIYAGATGLFVCVATGVPDPTLTWRLNSSELIASERIKITDEVEVIDNVTFVRSILEICDADYFTDFGEYMCTAEVPGLSDTASFNLTVVTQAPEFSIELANLTVVNGTEVVLECQAFGAPRPTITWLVNESPAPSEADITSAEEGIKTVNSTFDLGPVTASAVYTCVAENEFGVSMTSATITVQFPLVVVTDPVNTTVQLGEMAAFFCSFSGSPPPSQIQWFMEGSSDPLSLPKYDVTISEDYLSSTLSFEAALEDHDTQYYCRAMQTLVTGEIVVLSDAATLTVNSPPILSPNNIMLPAVLDGTLLLTFTISDAQPPVTKEGVIWSFRPRSAPVDSEPIILTPESCERCEFTPSEEMARLRINPVELEDEGNYTINVSNIAGSDSITISVDVVIGARIVNPPNDTTVHVGLNATFRCVATSEPPHLTLWLFEGAELNNSDKYVITDVDDAVSVLVVVDVAPSDDGEYMCDVRNPYSDDIETAVLTVISTPVVTAITVSPLIVLDEESATLSFLVEDDIPMVMLSDSDWSVTNEEGEHTLADEDPRFTFSPDFTSLTITDVHRLDEGTYTLTATNVAGTGSDSIFLDVQFLPVIDPPPEDANTFLGQDSVFICTVSEGEPRPNIMWTFEETPINTTDDKYTVTLSSEFSVSELVVRNVTLADEGLYTCIASNVHGSDSASAFLQPLVVPVVTPESPGLSLLNEETTISFNITSDVPRVTPGGITWFFLSDDTITTGSGSASGDGLGVISGDGAIRGFEITPESVEFTTSEFSKDRTSLVIPNTMYSNEGVYTIRVENLAGVTYGQTRIDVQASPRITDIELSQPRQHEGDMVTITCEVFAEPDAAVEFIFSPRGGSQTITIGPSERHTLTEAHGSLYYVTIHTLVISNLMTGDTGNYSCVAVNEFGTGMSEVVGLEVLVVPVVTPESPGLSLLNEETTISFNITSDVPRVTPGGITWFFLSDDTITTGSGSASGDGLGVISGDGAIRGFEIEFTTSEFSKDRTSLVIPNTMYSNEGVYTIRVENLAGVTYGQTRIDVQASPRITDIELSQPRQHEGDMVTITCEVLAEPDAAVEFIFSPRGGSQTITIGPSERHTLTEAHGSLYYVTIHTLVISNLMTGDAGNYSCVAVNEFGTGMSEVVGLEVLVEPEITPAQELYQFVLNQTDVVISFISSGREYPPLDPSNVTMFFRNMTGEVSDVVNTENRRLSDDGLSLEVRIVTVQENGTYWIVAENDAGVTISPPAIVEVFVNPTIEGGGEVVVVTEGEDVAVTFQCNATGNPSPSFTWTKNGEFLVTSLAKFDVGQTLTSELDNEDGRCPGIQCSTSGYLTITGVTVSDAGLYICRASIGVDAPAVQDVIIPEPYDLTVNIIIIDYCAGDPCGEFGECVDVGEGFICTCDPNYNGQLCDNRVVQLTPPVFVEQPITVFVGVLSRAFFTCIAEGNPQPTLEWTRDGEVLEGRVTLILEIPQVELEDRGMYRCTATNSEGSIQSDFAVLNLEGIAQFVLVIQLGTVTTSRRKRDTATDVTDLVAMLNEELTGSMIGNATVYSVAIQEGFNITASNGDIPLIFTFYEEVDETDGGGGEQPMAGPVIEVMFDVAEIERVIEEDVMLVAADLGLNVTVEEFVRFDACPLEDTIFEGITFSWNEAPIGLLSSLSCPCEAADLQRFATRECGGDFISGAEWNSASHDDCSFTSVTRNLCSATELSEIERLLVNVMDDLDNLGIAVVTEVLENMLNSSSGNTTESDTIFDIVDSILEVNSIALSEGQFEFNTSGRILSYLEILVDAYPAPSTTSLIRDSFQFLVIPASDIGTNVVLNLGPDNALSVAEMVPGVRIRVQLSDVDDNAGIVFGVYATSDLFLQRPTYIEEFNRTSYTLGSQVVSVHFQGRFSRASLETPVMIKLLKTPLAAENGTKTECSFWDQSLDEGYGAWSTDGCRLLSEDEISAMCECDHLTQFALIVDLTPEEPTVQPPVEEDDEDDDNIGAGSYVGGLVAIVFLIIIIITYLASGDLRSSVVGVSLINSSLCLSALFISYLISYYTTESDWACTVFSAIFHYLFLVASMSLMVHALLKTWQPERLTHSLSILLAIQLIVPVVVVIVSAAPDQDNYINEEFCRPQQEPYWYGLLLVGGLIHVVAWCSLLFSLFLVHVRREKFTTGFWFEEWLGIALILVLFEVAWGFGLPSTNSLGLGATRLVFQILFVVGCAALGFVMFFFFVLLPRPAREVWTGFINQCIPGRTGGFYTNRGDVEENLYVTGNIPGSGGAVGMSELTSKAPLRDEEEGAAKRSPEASAMTEKEEDPEHIINPGALEHDDEDGTVENESEEVKVNFGMFDDDADAAKDTKL